MEDVQPCQRCGESIHLIIERLPASRSPLPDLATVGCLTCGRIECAPALYSDGFADAAIERWNTKQQDRDDTGRLTSDYEPTPHEIEVVRGAICREFGNNGTDGYYIRILKAIYGASPLKGAWQPIDTAPKGGGAARVDDPAWVDPPLIALFFPEVQKQAVCRWDWYYSDLGNGYCRASAWVEPVSGDQIAQDFGEPTHWRELPLPPT